MVDIHAMCDKSAGVSFFVEADNVGTSRGRKRLHQRIESTENQGMHPVFIQWLTKVLQHPFFDFYIFHYSSINLKAISLCNTSFDSQDKGLSILMFTNKIYKDSKNSEMKMSYFATFGEL